MRGVYSAGALMLSIVAAHAQPAPRSLAGKSIVFSIVGDPYPFVLYTTSAGKVFLALGFAGEEFKCGWKGRFGLEGQIGQQRGARVTARGPGCTFSVEGSTAVTSSGGQLSFVFQGTGEVSGAASGGFLTAMSGRGPFPIQMSVSAEVDGETCTIPVGASIVGGSRYGWQVTSCYVTPGRAIRS